MPASGSLRGLDGSPLSRGDLRALTRFLEQSLDRGFRLAIIEAAGHADREAVLAEVAPLVGPGLLRVAIDEVPGAEVNPWQALKPLFETNPPRCLALWGFENCPEPEWPRRLNIQRDLFVRDFTFPWLLFIHPASRVPLRREAPDFCDFAVLWLRDDRSPHLPDTSTITEILTSAETSGDAPREHALLEQARFDIEAFRFDEARDTLYRFDLQPDHDVLDRVHRQLLGARLERRAGHLGLAEALVREARNALERQQLTPKARTLRRLADFELIHVLLASGQFGEAQALLHNSLPDVEDAVGREHPDYLVTRALLAIVLSEQGKFLEAEQILRDVIAHQEQRLGREHRDYIITLHNLAGLLLRQGRSAEAESLLLDARARPETSLGPEHPDHAASLYLLASALLQQGRSAEAEPVIRESLSLLERTLGRGHPNHATALSALGGALVQQGKHAEADRVLQESLSVQESGLGPDHPRLYVPLTNLAMTAAARGRTSEALQFLERALRIGEATFGKEHPEVQHVRDLLQQLRHRQ